MSALETRIPPPIVTLLVAGTMLAASAALPPAPVPDGARLGVSLLLLVLAGLFGAPAIRAFLQAGTTINPVAVDRASTLVTTGVYRFSRNPMYVAMALLLLSLAAGLGQPALLLGPAAFVLFIGRFQIVPEERAMTRIFGESYEAYRGRTRRWI